MNAVAMDLHMMCFLHAFDCSFRVWHGSNAHGEISATCDDWTSDSGQGDASLTTMDTLLSTSRISCSEPHYLLCIQIVRQ